MTVIAVKLNMYSFISWHHKRTYKLCLEHSITSYKFWTW